MKSCIGIRREDKNEWERRSAVSPQTVKELIEELGVKVMVQPSDIRVFDDEEYEESGADIEEDFTYCPIIFAVKEIPEHFFMEGRTYIFFSHTIKGQEQNMPMLQQMMEQKCTLIDYEKITDDKGRRLIFFGKFAGLAGMIDTLSGLGQRLKNEGHKTPLAEIKLAHEYESFDEAKKSIKAVGAKIKKSGLPLELMPMVFGFAGYGNVSRGAQEILNLLPVDKVEPDELPELFQKRRNRKKLHKVVFKEEHLVQPLDGEFDLQDYYDNPDNYDTKFDRYIPFLTVLMNCIYWDPRYPRLLTKSYLRHYFDVVEEPRLRIVGDISVDVNGSIEITNKVTTPAKPFFTYDPLTEEYEDDIGDVGVSVLAVDNLPCELPRESSDEFSIRLKPFILDILQADFRLDFDSCELSPEVKRAVILYKGKLTEDFKYLEKYL